jgi:hypothetical protein
VTGPSVKCWSWQHTIILPMMQRYGGTGVTLWLAKAFPDKQAWCVRDAYNISGRINK